MRCSRLIAALPWLLAAARAQTTTTVVGTLADSFGNAGNAKLTATCQIRSGAVLTAASGWIVTGVAHSVPVTNGALSVALVPTDTSTPASYHEMRCHVPLQAADGRSCEGNAALVAQGLCVVGPAELGPVYLDVPTSSSPVQLKDHYRTARPPAPPLTVDVGQLVDRLRVGGCLESNGASVAPTGVPCGTGTGGSGLSATATWTQIEAGTAGAGGTTATSTWAQIEAQ